LQFTHDRCGSIAQPTISAPVAHVGFSRLNRTNRKASR
jgi:hypothetical protein